VPKFVTGVEHPDCHTKLCFQGDVSHSLIIYKYHRTYLQNWNEVCDSVTSVQQ